MLGRGSARKHAEQMQLQMGGPDASVSEIADGNADGNANECFDKRE